MLTIMALGEERPGAGLRLPDDNIRLAPPAPHFERDWACIDSEHVTQASKGRDFDSLERGFGAAAGEPEID